MPGAKNPSDLAAKIQAALTGVQKVLAAGGKLQIGGETLSPAQIEAQLAGYLPAFKAVEAQYAKYQQAVAARTALEPEAREFLVGLRAALLANYKRGNPVLSQFGMGTGAPGKQSPETMVIAAATRALTRKKRGTTGKKQRAAIQVVGLPAVTVGGTKAVVPPVVDTTPPAVAAALAESESAATPAVSSGGE